jgi:hypothetical protein
MAIPTENRKRNKGSKGKRVDPTANVIALSKASNVRQDDLRKLNDKRFNSRLAALRKEVILRCRNIDQHSKLRADYDNKLRKAEAKRINAIRAVDVNAVSVASQRANDQATALATTVAQSAEVMRNQVSQAAETMRNLVATTAATALQNQQQQFGALSTRLAVIEQAMSEGKGKQSYSDPMIVELVAEMKAIRGTKGEGQTAMWGYILGGLGLLALVADVIIHIK